jgi:MOSC domain-containing protein
MPRPRHVGRPVTLARDEAVSPFDEGPVHLVTTAMLAAVSAAAFGGEVVPPRVRPNLLVDTGRAERLVEDGWIGRRVAVGEVVLAIRCGMTRCLMVGLPQVALPREARLLRAIVQLNDTRLGVVCDVLRGGTVEPGALVEVLDA